MKAKHLAGLFATLLAVACGTQKPASVVIYYSQGGTTKAVAEQFAAQTGSDIIELVPETPYPDTYQGTIEESREEATNGIGRPLVQSKFNLKKYDTIYLGYPIWFGTYAPPITTFLADNDLSGKKLVLFCTFGSGGRKASAAKIAAECPEAEILGSFGLAARRVDSAAEEVERFLASLGAGEETPMLGAFGDQHPISEEEMAVFQKATESYGYLNLEPLSVATQLVAGMNYLFICHSGGPNGSAEVEVSIFKPLGDADPYVVSVER